ncbi:hypothetical protein R3P38DRAFT_2766014 [Favolaschia claudopus]|uniref:Uncharacterized protein n=1 Tax=Favolaschia claudopus TaxID=2862362 RepID=A0AAW0CYL8_9AGAR
MYRPAILFTLILGLFLTMANAAALPERRVMLDKQVALNTFLAEVYDANEVNEYVGALLDSDPSDSHDLVLYYKGINATSISNLEIAEDARRRPDICSGRSTIEEALAEYHSALRRRPAVQSWVESPPSHHMKSFAVESLPPDGRSDSGFKMGGRLARERYNAANTRNREEAERDWNPSRSSSTPSVSDRNKCTCRYTMSASMAIGSDGIGEGLNWYWGSGYGGCAFKISPTLTAVWATRRCTHRGAQGGPGSDQNLERAKYKPLLRVRAREKSEGLEAASRLCLGLLATWMKDALEPLLNGRKSGLDECRRRTGLEMGTGMHGLRAEASLSGGVH